MDKVIFQIDSAASYHAQYQLAKEQPEHFWNEIAKHYSWRKPWQQTLQWEFETPDVKWFVNGKLNITENCLDRHIDQRGDQTCILWEPNDPKDEAKKFTYRDVLREVCRMANTLKSLGVKKGDRVCIYLPMIPELAFAVLACARIGAVHSVVFAGFSASSIADRIADSDCRFVITADGQNRGISYRNNVFSWLDSSFRISVILAQIASTSASMGSPKTGPCSIGQRPSANAPLYASRTNGVS